MLKRKRGLAGSRTARYHNSVFFQETAVQHRVEFNYSSFLSGHSDLLCFSFEISQIIQDSFLGGLVPRTVKENYLAASDLSRAQDVGVHHVLNIRLDCCTHSTYSPGDSFEAIDQPRVLVEENEQVALDLRR